MVCTWKAQRRTFYFFIIFLFSVYLQLSNGCVSSAKATYSPNLPDIAVLQIFFFKKKTETTLGLGGCETVVELDSCLSLCCPHPHPMYSALQYVPLSHHKSSVIGTHKDCFHSAAMKPSDGDGWTGRPFVLFLFFFFPQWHGICGFRLHISPDHNYLLLTGELFVFHFKSDFTF